MEIIRNKNATNMKKFIERKKIDLEMQTQPEEDFVNTEHEGKIYRIRISPRKEAERNLKYMATYPEPKILCYFFRKYGFMHSHSIGNMMFDKARKEDVKSFLVDLLTDYSKEDQKDFLFEIKKYYENLLRNADSIENSKVKDIQIKEIEFIDEENHAFLFRSFYKSCLFEYILKKSYEHNNNCEKKSLMNSIEDLPNIKLLKKGFVKYIVQEKERIKEMYDYVITELQNLEKEQYNQNSSNKFLETMNNDFKRVQWRGNDAELYQLMNKLKEIGYITDIDKKNLIKIVENFFLDKSGKPFKEKNIVQGINNLLTNNDHKSRNADLVDKAIPIKK